MLSIQRVDAVKIDVEGAEWNVLKGSKQSFKTLKWMMIEIHWQHYREYEEKVRTIIELLGSYGFICKKIDSEHLFCERL
jgi:cobyric acid synthase